MHLSRHFHLAKACPGLRRGRPWPQIIDQPQDLSEQVSRYRHLGQLERDVPPVAHHFRTDLHQLFPQCGQRPVAYGSCQAEIPQELSLRTLSDLEKPASSS